MSAAQQLRNGGDLDTIHALAGAHWDDRIGSARVQARNWRLMAFLSILLAMGSLAGLIHLGAQPKHVPYFVEIDKLGQATFLGELGRSSFRPDETQIKFHLERFVQGTRSVSSDQEINKQRVHEAYALLTARAGEQLRSYFKAGGDPVVRAAAGETITTNTIADVPIADGVYQIDWRQQHWDVNGNLKRDTLWRGMFQFLVQKPANIEDVRKNPIGLYIDQFHWDCIGEGCGGQRDAR